MFVAALLLRRERAPRAARAAGPSATAPAPQRYAPEPLSRLPRVVHQLVGTAVLPLRLRPWLPQLPMGPAVLSRKAAGEAPAAEAKMDSPNRQASRSSQLRTG
eukprot:2913441-Pleurochrysis_carterae.AAC.1